MARTLTTPDPQPDATQQAISGFRFETPHVRNAGDTAMELSKLQIQVWYEVITYDTDGVIIKKETRTVPYQELDYTDPLLPVPVNVWPAGFVTAVKDVYTRLHAEAENAGLIVGAGTDEPIE